MARIQYTIPNRWRLEIMPIALLFTPSDFQAFLRPCYLMSEKDRTQSKVFKLIWFLLWYSFQRKRKTGMIVNFLKSNWIENIRKICLIPTSNIVSLKAQKIWVQFIKDKTWFTWVGKKYFWQLTRPLLADYFCKSKIAKLGTEKTVVA